MRGESVDVIGSSSRRDVAVCVLVVLPGSSRQREFLREIGESRRPFRRPFYPVLRAKRSFERGQHPCEIGTASIRGVLAGAKGRSRPGFPAGDRRGEGWLDDDKRGERHKVRLRRVEGKRRSAFERLARILGLQSRQASRSLKSRNSGHGRDLRSSYSGRTSRSPTTAYSGSPRRVCSPRTTSGAWPRRWSAATGSSASRAARCPTSSWWTEAAASSRRR